MAIYKHSIKKSKKLSVPNPVLEIKRLKEKESERTRFLDRDEETALRLKIGREHLPELDLALSTGLRRNELFRLRWTDVNLRVRILTVTKSKNGKPRHVPLNSTACAAFEQLAARRDDTGYVIPGPPAPRGRDWREWFEDAVKAAKISDFHFHDLRHTFASRLVMAGVDLRTVMELMGHSDISMTMRYAHLAQAHKQDAVDRLVENSVTGVSTNTRTDTKPVSAGARDRASVN
jgi:integrase